VIRRGFQWSIGTGEHIPVWDHPWLSNAARIVPSTHHHLEWPSITVSDLLVTPQKQWNMELINAFFDSATARNIFNTLLLPSVTHDVPVWKFERDGAYSVKSAYNDILNHDMAVVQHRVPGNWNRVWSLKLPPKVKNFMWRACRNCLPTRIRLQTKGDQCTDRCAVCDDFGKDNTHLFFMCNKSMLCWQRIGFWSPLMVVFDIDASFSINVFAILQHLDQQQKQVFSVTLWSIWKHRNNKVWNNVTDTTQTICARAESLLTSWRNA
jgi:hypothetical protein